MALLFFNIGVEVGQLIFVAAVLGVVRLLSRIRIPAWAALVPPYAIGSIAMFWTFERISAL
jgi:hypothetical protein